VDEQAAVDLAGETAKVRAAPQGARRDILNRAAFRLARLVQAGKLAEGEVRTDHAYFPPGPRSREHLRSSD
jgi:hypothetical protein